MISLLLASEAIQAQGCALSRASVNTKDRSISWTVKFPKGVNKLQLGSDANSMGWAIDPAKGRIEGHMLLRTGAKDSGVSLTAVLPKITPRQDRVYPSALVFDDHSIAVLSSIFNFSFDGIPQCTHFVAHPKSKVGAGHIWNQASINSSISSPGYVVFGSPRVERSGRLTIVSDKKVPLWVRKKIKKILDAAILLYSHAVGQKKLPPVIVYTDSRAGAAYHWGDRLPDSITLGLYGSAWRIQTPSQEDELDEFLAHEIFHVWNSEVKFADGGESLLAIEGGAELASVFARSEKYARPGKFILNKISDAMNQCQFDLAYGGSVHDLLQSPHPGRVPYHCGMIMMFAATAKSNLPWWTGDAFFKSWRDILAREPDKAHVWMDIAGKGASSERMHNLESAVASKGKFFEFLKALMSSDGFAIEPAESLSPEIKMQLATVTMANLMQVDCAGEASFWSVETGFQIDADIKTCKSLRAGAIVTTLLDEKPWDDPVGLANRIGLLCKKGGSIPVGYSDGGTISYLKCIKQLPNAPVPMKIVIKKR